jgi:hypothetical protein
VDIFNGFLIGRDRVLTGRDPSRSRALTQPCQDLETGIAVSGQNANFSLEVAHRALGVAPDPAVGAVGVKAERGEAALKLLDVGERRGALAAGEGRSNSPPLRMRSARWRTASVAPPQWPMCGRNGTGKWQSAGITRPCR